MSLFQGTTVWPNQLFKFVALLSSIGMVIYFGVRVHLDPGIIVAIVIPLATTLAQSLPAIEKTKPISIPPAAVQAVVVEAVKAAVSMYAPPPLPPLPRIDTIPAPPNTDMEEKS